MKTFSRTRFALVALLLLAFSAGSRVGAEPSQFILFNLQNKSTNQFHEIRKRFPLRAGASIEVGCSGIFSYLQHPRSQVQRGLREFLDVARETKIPVVIQLDGEQWWANRPDLWNWWDPSRPGFSESNRHNVEWTGWSPDDAIKIAWRNWGSQLRVLPPPNLMSPPYREACHAEMRALLPIVLDWWRALPPDEKHLLVGIKLGWESSIGVNAWYYPGGNALLDKPEAEDPRTGTKGEDPPARGVVQIGFAAVKTAGLKAAGKIIEQDLAQIAQRHMQDLCRLAAELGVPRDKLFTHAAGWKPEEALYDAALNDYSCPGWSFYHNAADPARDKGVMRALERTDAPYWAAVEWLFQGPPETTAWRSALEATLADSRCRYLCVFNYEPWKTNAAVLQAIEQMIGSKKRAAVTPKHVRQRNSTSAPN